MFRDRARIATILAAIVACVLLAKGADNYAREYNTRAYDLILDWNGARVLRMGLSPFTDAGLAAVGGTKQLGFCHPPTTPLWLLPLSGLDLKTAKHVWNALTLILLALALWWIAVELELPKRPLLVTLLFGAVLASSWMRYHLRVAQLSMLIAFLYVYAWRALRRERPNAAGIALGLACTIKFFPFAVVGGLFLCGLRRSALVAGATWAVAALAVTTRVGFDGWMGFLEATKPYVELWLTRLSNASLPGIMQRLRYPICEFPPGDHPVWATGSYLATAILGALAGLAGWVGRGAQERGVDVPFALCVALSMLAGPYTWEHYDVVMLLPVAVAIVAVRQARGAGLSKDATRAAAATAATVAGLLAMPIGPKNLQWERWHQVPRVGSHVLLHTLEVLSWIGPFVLFGLLALLLVWARRQAPQAFAPRLRWSACVSASPPPSA